MKTKKTAEKITAQNSRKNPSEVITNSELINSLLLEAGYEDETMPSYKVERTDWDGGVSITIEDEDYTIYAAYGSAWQVELQNGTTTMEMRDILFCVLVDENAEAIICEYYDLIAA